MSLAGAPHLKAVGLMLGRRRLRRAIALMRLWSRSLGTETLWSAVDLGNGEVLATPIALQE